MKNAVLVLLFLALLPLCAAAENTAEEAVSAVQMEELSADKITQALPVTARSALRGVTPQSPDLQKGVGDVLQSVESAGAARQAASLALKILAAVFLCGICNEFLEKGKELCSIACVLTIAALSLSDVRSIMTLCAQTINQMLLLSKTLFPLLATAAATAGMPMEGAAKYAVTVMGIDVLLWGVAHVFMPLVYLFIALVIAGSITQNAFFGKMAELVSGFVSGGLKIIVTLFLAYITISSAVAAGGDSVARRAARFAVSSGVPVVGSALSDGSEAILASAGIIKNGLGVYGLLGVLAILATPIVIIFIRFIAFKILAGAAGTAAGEGVIKLLDGLTRAYGMAVGICIAMATMLLISITQIILMVG